MSLETMLSKKILGSKWLSFLSVGEKAFSLLVGSVFDSQVLCL